jgi:hypothetical protein
VNLFALAIPLLGLRRSLGWEEYHEIPGTGFSLIIGLLVFVIAAARQKNVVQDFWRTKRLAWREMLLHGRSIVTTAFVWTGDPDVYIPTHNDDFYHSADIFANSLQSFDKVARQLNSAKGSRSSHHVAR